MKRTITLVVTLVLAGLVVGVASAQPTEQNPEIQKAKEEMAVVFDLGRMFGYIRTMEEEEDDLRLTADQVRKLYVIMTAIKQTERMDPDVADDWLIAIEDDILNVKQLVYVDQLYLARASTAGSGDGSGGGNGSRSGSGETGSATGSIATYVAGGKFNPIVDSTNKMGEEFLAYYEELGSRR